MDPSDLVCALPKQQHVLVTGGTGFVGSRLVAGLMAGGHAVIVLARNPATAMAALQAGARVVTSMAQIASDARLDGIVNLAGEPISNGLWTTAKRERIVDSRVCMTRACLDLIARLEVPPKVFVSGSAIGWYGLRGNEVLDETSTGTNCFSRDVCTAWEAATEGAGVRTVLLRTGLVLDRSGGMLARMLTPFKLGLGGRFGDGRHWMSWIHRDDLVRLIVHCMAEPDLSGAINATAPQPVTNRDFTKALGRALRRPAVLPVPTWPLKLALGDFARELLLGGQRVMPVRAQDSGFAFAYPDIATALREIVGRA
ncbi:MAG: TIGR01777 family oxidoreductase [Novosphingobium sp.]|uniref:TIGR01777 family oxidoreductase n=1 Tax=Novosphingobium sp. TaxID=1874826 RepID=UPI0032BB86AB